MPFAYANCLDIYYEEHGQGEPLVLIPGIGSVAESWRHQISYFKEKYRVIVFDNRGCGKSSVPEGSYCISDIAEDVDKLMDCLQVETAYFVGRCMGGKVLQEMAIRYPGRIKKMVLSNTSACVNPLTKMVLQSWRELAEEPVSPDLFKRSLVPWVYTQNLIAALDRDYFATPLEAPLETYAAQCKASLNHNVTEILSTIRIPTLIIAGERDILTPVEDAAIITERIPNSHLVIMKDAAHSPYLENSRYYNDIVAKFLAVS